MDGLGLDNLVPARSPATTNGSSMNTLLLIWSAILGIVAVLWASRHAALTRNQRSEKPLSSRTGVKLPQPAPKVTFLVAAKDEEANIEACVSSLLSQDYPALEVIAINDRSQDRTAEILDGIKSTNGIPYTPLHISELTEGWFGKNNAMHQGVQGIPFVDLFAGGTTWAARPAVKPQVNAPRIPCTESAISRPFSSPTKSEQNPGNTGMRVAR